MHVHPIMGNAFNRESVDLVLITIDKTSSMQHVGVVAYFVPFDMGK